MFKSMPQHSYHITGSCNMSTHFRAFSITSAVYTKAYLYIYARFHLANRKIFGII